jgi:hypothetical protein
VAELERDYGPQVPPFLAVRGRPRKGTVVAPAEPRSVKMPPAFWNAMTEAAGRSGLSLHGAMREALLDWTRTHTPPSGG